jgi:hypothetical protein
MSYRLECLKNSDVKITHKYTLGDLSMQTFCVRFDPNDKYIAAGKSKTIVNDDYRRVWRWNNQNFQCLHRKVKLYFECKHG